MNSISFFKALLMKEIDEELKGGQKKLDVAEPKGKITAADFKALRAKKGMKKEVDMPTDYSGKPAIPGPGPIVGMKKEDNMADSNLPGSPAMQDLLDRVADDWGKDSDLYSDLEGAIVGWSDRNGNLTPKGKIAIKALLSNWDVLEDYGWLLDPKPADYTGETSPIEEDHEVSMAHNSLESIIKSAMELKAKLGNDERNIPGWIQDHITNAENYIDQAAQGFHELDHHDQEGEHDMDELPDGTEEVPAGDEEDDEMALQSIMESLLGEAKKKPSAGLTKKQKSAIVKKAKKGKDIGKKGKGFKGVVKAAKAGGARDPQAVAAAQMWKSQAKKAK